MKNLAPDLCARLSLTFIGDIRATQRTAADAQFAFNDIGKDVNIGTSYVDALDERDALDAAVRGDLAAELFDDLAED